MAANINRVRPIITGRGQDGRRPRFKSSGEDRLCRLAPLFRGFYNFITWDRVQ